MCIHLPWESTEGAPGGSGSARGGATPCTVLSGGGTAHRGLERWSWGQAHRRRRETKVSAWYPWCTVIEIRTGTTASGGVAWPGPWKPLGSGGEPATRQGGPGIVPESKTSRLRRGRRGPGHATRRVAGWIPRSEVHAGSHSRRRRSGGESCLRSRPGHRALGSLLVRAGCVGGGGVRLAAAKETGEAFGCVHLRCRGGPCFNEKSWTAFVIVCA